ncbi:gamma-aminobutyric acid receptor subunit alpha-6 [Toxorhynchites rutilus septentrionalis]|uniref:gamma-aminobutyric acid receptor subunit alpha-6 n=1 Tax=Toxorhynchites rutilus septentrionalis TaxID=329112 RepID=UPI002478E5B1|nr:gamma-aminobutyric acid receptor subunit alpha-6 [Toxorhynchites rutilus septentrionalis]XP_055618959.1 gamma-aminobutyric acid receptor subunit alpha-6 [Toxorhynchites rutilus septentrionalis]
MTKLLTLRGSNDLVVKMLLLLILVGSSSFGKLGGQGVSCYTVKTGHVQQHNTLENGLLIAANISIGHLRKHKYFYYLPRSNNAPHNRKQRNSSFYSKIDDNDASNSRVNRPPAIELRRLRHVSVSSIASAQSDLLDMNKERSLRSSSSMSLVAPAGVHEEEKHQPHRSIQRYYIYSTAPRKRSPDGEEVRDNFIADKYKLFRVESHINRPPIGSLNASRHSEYNDYKTVRKRSAADDMLSKNITQILENLLKSYENSQMPTHGQDVPTIVKTNILIRSMGPVSELDMDYSMDCYFRQYWRDKRLSFHGPIKSLSLSIKMLERIWRPDTYFYNGKHSHVHTITVPNKLLRLSQDGEILYSMRLTIKASCLMQLRSFPMDRQSCPLVLGSYAYSRQQLLYQWKDDDSVNFVPGMTLSQFDLISFHQKNYTFARREGEFSVLHVSFNLQRHTGYFLIQVYVPCILIVVLSWVSFWIHREATSDRVGLGITTVLTLSTISLDSRTDLPKVRYATALDWFLLMSFFYCIATLLEFAGVHYFTKVGSGEIPLDEDEWEDIDNVQEIGGGGVRSNPASIHDSPQRLMAARRRSSLICPIYNDPQHMFKATTSHLSTMERTTQTEPPKEPGWKQLWLCFLGDDQFRRRRQREASGRGGASRHVNSVSLIDQAARVMFPASFTFFNVLYWLCYYTYQADFTWAPLKEQS